MSLTVAAPVLLAAALDLAVGEPPTRVHPVAWLGRLIAPYDADWSRPRAVGALAAVKVPLVAAGVAWLAVAGAARVAPLAGAAVAGVVLFSTTSLRRLVTTARDVVALTDEDLPGAREALLALAGRDASDLSPAQVRSAAVESAAENLADGLVAPLAAFALLAPLGIAPAAAAAAWVKGVNTLDSMLGYREKPVGWASARLDDLVIWLPARLSAVLLAVAGGSPGAVGRARAFAAAPPSPNSGWPMATLAAALDRRLAKPGSYELFPAAADPTTADGQRGTRIVTVAGALAFALTALVGLVVGETVALPGLAVGDALAVTAPAAPVAGVVG